MLKLTITEKELYDEVKNEFVKIPGTTVQLEHSLVSLSKWESIWHIPFIGNSANIDAPKMLSYIKCMNMTQNVPEEVFEHLSKEETQQISDYINNPMTATWFNEKDGKGKGSGHNGEAVTSELIYYWMTDLNIPPEYQKWHLNRLLTLIRVCSVKSQGGKKMSQKDILSQNAALNKARRAKFHNN